MRAVRTRLGEGGRLVIPADFRKALGLRAGDDVLVQLGKGELRVFAIQKAVRRAQEIVAKYVPADRSLVDELIEERRQQAAYEEMGP